MTIIITDRVQQAADRLREALETHCAACRFGTVEETERTRADVEAAREALRIAQGESQEGDHA
jgi:hypothetical protein